MKIDFIHEPELEFGAGRHIDPRFGILNYGPLDSRQRERARNISVGVVGTAQTVEGLSAWLDRCRSGIAAKRSNQPNLFPRFPGFSEDTRWNASLNLSVSLRETIPQRKFDQFASKGRDVLIEWAVQEFLARMEQLNELHAVDVFVCAPPIQLVPGLESVEEGANTSIDFHHLLKAKAMRLAKPVQIVLPMTYDETVRLKQRKKSDRLRQLQDEATRAWNFHTALYYKAKGIPWRLPRSSAEFTSCYVGISFFESIDKSKLLTSVAEIFNQRGEGVVVRGGSARIDKEDRQVHMDLNDAYDLLTNALDSYKRMHHTLPARVVLHKTSSFSEQEKEGFRASSDKLGVHTVEMVSLRPSGIKLFRNGQYPSLRGTFLNLDDESGIIYTRGSVEFFSTYPGMYVPVSMRFDLDVAEETARFHAEEILSLTKMNWNNTQFDGFDPITIRAARQVSKILKHIPEGDPMQGHYSFYM